jgi:phthalate 4,5-dioxygenase
MKALRQFMAGEVPASARPEARDYAHITATGGRMKSVDQDWRVLER